MPFAIVVVGRDGKPFFLVDDVGVPAVYVDEEEAFEAMMDSPASISMPSDVIELPE